MDTTDVKLSSETPFHIDMTATSFLHAHKYFACVFLCADRRIGVKAQEAGAVLLTLNLLKQNTTHAKRAAACLWVIQVFSSSGTNKQTQSYTQMLQKTGCISTSCEQLCNYVVCRGEPRKSTIGRFDWDRSVTLARSTDAHIIHSRNSYSSLLHCSRKRGGDVVHVSLMSGG